MVQIVIVCFLNGSKFSFMVQYGPKWSLVVQNYTYRSNVSNFLNCQMVQNGQKKMQNLKSVFYGLILSKTFQNSPKKNSFKMVQTIQGISLFPAQTVSTKQGPLSAQVAV